MALAKAPFLVCRGRTVHWLVLPLFISLMRRKELGHHDSGCKEFKGRDAGCWEGVPRLCRLLAVGMAATMLAAGTGVTPPGERGHAAA